MNTLRDIFRRSYLFDCKKPGLSTNPEWYTDDMINQLTNSEFLSELSDALEELLTQDRP